jgi:hypothetical protein
VEAIDSESWVSLFEPDTLTSFQYHEKWLRRRYPDPEKMLAFAVLEDAISCFQRFSSAQSVRGKARFQEEEDWFFHERSDRLFSFEKICEVLDLNPDYIRIGLTRWRSRPPARNSKLRLFYVVRPCRRAQKQTARTGERYGGRGNAAKSQPNHSRLPTATDRLHKLNS